jgi:hypothetical protein
LANGATRTQGRGKNRDGQTQGARALQHVAAVHTAVEVFRDELLGDFTLMIQWILN